MATCRLTVLLSRPSRVDQVAGAQRAGVLEQGEQPVGRAVEVGVQLAGQPGGDGARAAQQQADLALEPRRRPSCDAGRSGRAALTGSRPGAPDDERRARPALRHQVSAGRSPNRRHGGLGRDPPALGELELLEQLVHPGLQRLDPRLELDDPLDAGEVDAVLLGQPLHLAQQRDVPRAVAPAAARRCGRG